MHKAIDAIARKIMFTESEWNPKVAIGRIVAATIPDRALHLFKKRYYGYLLSRMPDDWQDKDAVVVKHLVSSGDSVIDIGASIGGYTRYLSKLVGNSGRVYSFEPYPPTHEYLQHNVTQLKLGNVQVFDCALSDKQGQASIVIPRYRWGTECHYDATLESGYAASDCRRVDVAVSTLDCMFARVNERISFVKCDVNYHELQCVRGGSQLLERSKPAWLIEVLPDPDVRGSRAAQLFDLLGEYGYTAYWFDGSHLLGRKPGERSQNYFFLTAQHLMQLPAGLLVRDRCSMNTRETDSLLSPQA